MRNGSEGGPVASRLGSFREDIPQARECRSKRFGLDRTQAPYQPLFIESAHLIQWDQTALLLESDGNTKGCRTTASGHWRDYYSTQIVMHFWRRNDNARTSFLNLAADRRVQRYEPYFATHDNRRHLRRWPARPHHFNSLSAAFPNSGQTGESSPASARRFAASAHPARGVRLTGASTIRSLSSDKSRSSPTSRPICERTGFGIITPDELPSFRIGARIALFLNIAKGSVASPCLRSNKVITQLLRDRRPLPTNPAV